MNGSRNSLQFYPGLAAFTDAVEALPQETIRHFTLLREVDAKACGPEKLLRACMHEALLLPPSDSNNTLDPDTSLRHHSNHHRISGNSHRLGEDALPNGEALHGDAAELEFPDHTRRSRLHQVRMIISDLLLTLDEKIHVISTASEALTKHLVRIDDAYEVTGTEIDSIIRDGNPLHWAYGHSFPEALTGQRQGGNGPISVPGGVSSYNGESYSSDPLATGQGVGVSRAESRREAMAKRHAQAPDISESRGSGGSGSINHGHDASASIHDMSPHPPAAKRRKGVAQGSHQTKPSGPERVPVAPRGTAPSLATANQVPGGPGVATKKNAAQTTVSGATNSTKSTNNRKSTTPNPYDKPILAGQGNGTKGTGMRNPRSKTQGTKGETPKHSSRPEPDMTPELKTIPFGTTMLQNPRPQFEKPLVEANERTPTGTKEAPHEKHNLTKAHAVMESITKAGLQKEDTPQVSSFGLPSTTDKHIKPGEVLEGPTNRGITGTSNRTGAKAPSTSELSKSSQLASRKATSSKLSKSGKGASITEKGHEGGEEDRDNAGEPAEERARGAGEGEEDGDEEDEEGDPDEMRYCYCNQVSYGKMVACDGPGCQREWFHLPCVGLTHMPSSKDKWFCNDCRNANPAGSKQTKATQNKTS
ncbi:hypothetical protein ABW19_dt0207633 [Dactylella cylindrospora]|nr:hypothetical protein ABW19_dt0207633 [Dactylella cylindrospora]